MKKETKLAAGLCAASLTFVGGVVAYAHYLHDQTMEEALKLGREESNYLRTLLDDKKRVMHDFNKRAEVCESYVQQSIAPVDSVQEVNTNVFECMSSCVSTRFDP